MNGYVKDGAREALDNPMRRRDRGVAAQSLFVALLLAAANIRKIETFLREQAAVEAGTLRRLPRRRRTRALGAWQPDAPSVATAGHDPSLTGSPVTLKGLTRSSARSAIGRRRLKGPVSLDAASA
jgi:hypothetical protein